MKRSVALWQLLGFLVTVLGGTLLHFLYEWTGQSTWSALISGVNESTWEHMKLLFVPMFVFAWLESGFFRQVASFWCVKLIGILTGILSIPVLFYTYNGVFGPSPDWVNISIFCVAAALSFLLETWLFWKKWNACFSSRLALVLLSLVGVFFVLYTFWAPHIPLFRDPVTGSYGVTLGMSSPI